MKSTPRLLLFAVSLWVIDAGGGGAVAQKLVNPETVAPEFRDAAEKRQAEQVKQRDCKHKAFDAKVLPRDLTAFLARCLDDEPSR